jgi:hypothetical protein
MPNYPSQPHAFHFDQTGKDWDSMDSIEIHRHYSAAPQSEVKPTPLSKDSLTPLQPRPELDVPTPDTPSLNG